MANLALTFDDGPDPRWTPAVLDALRAAGAQAAFFVLAGRARRHPELLRRMVAEGHLVAVHAARHVRHTTMFESGGRTDLESSIAAITAAGVPRPSLWRTPWGVEAGWTRPLAAAAGLELVGWTADSHDWRGDSARSMLAALGPSLSAGAVVLAHDAVGPGARRPGCAETVALIAPLVAAGRAQGLEPSADLGTLTAATGLRGLSAEVAA